MTTLSTTKAIGGIGAIMVLLVPVPTIGWILGIAGLIMVLIAIKGLSDLLQDKSIFNNMLYSVICEIVAIVVLGVSVIFAIYRLLGLGTFTGSGYMPGPNVTAGDWIAFALGWIPFLLAIWVLFIISAVFIRISLSKIDSGLSMRLFGTTGLIFLIGAVTTIIAIGFLLILVAEIMLAIAFFSISETSGKLKGPMTTT